MTDRLVAILLPSGFVCLGFLVYWTTRHPREFWDAIMFKERTAFDVTAGVFSWVYVIGAASTILWLCTQVTK